MRKLRIREMRQLAQSHRTNKQWGQIHSSSKACALPTPSQQVTIKYLLIENGGGYTYLHVRMVLYFLVYFICFFRIISGLVNF